MTCIEAASTLHAGVASLIAPNPISRPRRRGLLLPAAIALAIGELLSRTPAGVRLALYAASGLCVLAWTAELATGWRISRQAGPLKENEAMVRSMVAGPVVRGGTFGAWPSAAASSGLCSPRCSPSSAETASICWWRLARRGAAVTYNAPKGRDV